MRPLCGSTHMGTPSVQLAPSRRLPPATTWMTAWQHPHGNPPFRTQAPCGAAPTWMMMWHTSPVALAPVMVSTDTTLPVKGFLGPKVFMGRPISSSSRGTSARFTCNRCSRHGREGGAERRRAALRRRSVRACGAGRRSEGLKRRGPGGWHAREGAGCLGLSGQQPLACCCMNRRQPSPQAAAVTCWCDPTWDAAHASREAAVRWGLAQTQTQTHWRELPCCLRSHAGRLLGCSMQLLRRRAVSRSCLLCSVCWRAAFISLCCNPHRAGGPVRSIGPLCHPTDHAGWSIRFMNLSNHAARGLTEVEAAWASTRRDAATRRAAGLAANTCKSAGARSTIDAPFHRCCDHAGACRRERQALHHSHDLRQHLKPPACPPHLAHRGALHASHSDHLQ